MIYGPMWVGPASEHTGEMQVVSPEAERQALCATAEGDAVQLVDTAFVSPVEVGDIVFVHGGVAFAALDGP